MKTIYLTSLFLHASTAFQPSGLQQKVVQKFSRCNNALKSHDDMSDNIDRRSFLSSGAILASSVLLTGASPSAFAEDNQAAASRSMQNTEEEAHAPKQIMKHDVPEIGESPFACWQDMPWF